MPTSDLEKLDYKNLADLLEGKVEIDLFDSHPRRKGLVLSISKSGHWGFHYRCRFEGKQKMISLDALDFEHAVDQLRRMKDDIARGVNPWAKRKAERAMSNGTNTFGALCDRYLKEYAAAKRDGGKEDKKMIGARLLPAWESRDAGGITRPEVRKLLEGIIAEGSSSRATHLEALIKKIFNFAIDNEILANDAANPARSLGLKKVKGFQWTEHCRPLNDDAKSEKHGFKNEIKEVWAALGSREDDFAGVFRLMLLTGQRPAEIFGAKWEEFDGLMRDDKMVLWTIPWNRIKTAKSPDDSHTIPLVGDALALVRKIYERTDRHATLVFPTFKDTVSAKAIIRREMRILRKEMRLTQPWKLYCLRATFSTGLTNLEANFVAGQIILNHRLPGVSGDYIRSGECMVLLAKTFLTWHAHIRKVTRHLQAVGDAASAS